MRYADSALGPTPAVVAAARALVANAVAITALAGALAAYNAHAFGLAAVLATLTLLATGYGLTDHPPHA